MVRRGATKRPPAEANRTAEAESVAALLAPLLQASPRDFVAVRAEVVAALKAAGHAAEAARTRTLRRPLPSVWATNALARAQSNAIAALLALGKRVRADEAAMLAGGDGRGFIDEARALRQQAVQLSRRAEAIAKEAGVALNAAAGRRIAQTLQAAAAGDDATRAALAAGQLTADLAAPSGFGGGDGDRSPAGGADRALSAALAASTGGARVEGSLAAGGHGHARDKPDLGRSAKAADDVGDRTHAAVTARAEVAARKHAAAAARADATARRKADAVAARAKAAAQRRAEDAARKRAAADRRRLAAAEREVAARRRVVERARAAVGAAEDRLRAAKDALAAAETAAEAARRRAAD